MLIISTLKRYGFCNRFIKYEKILVKNQNKNGIVINVDLNLKNYFIGVLVKPIPNEYDCECDKTCKIGVNIQILKILHGKNIFLMN